MSLSPIKTPLNVILLKYCFKSWVPLLEIAQLALFTQNPWSAPLLAAAAGLRSCCPGPCCTLLLLSSRAHSPQISKPLALCTTCSQPQLVEASQPHSVRMMWWNLKRTFVCWIILTEGDYRDGSREQMTSSRCCWQEAEARLGPVSSSPLGFLPLTKTICLTVP